MNKPSLNVIQHWALGYWIEMDRRISIEDKHDELEIQTFNLFPERWGDLYRERLLPGVPGDVGNAFGPGEKEIPVTDIDDINKWYDGLDRSRGITGEQAMRYQDPTALLGLAVGEGRRV